MLKHVFAIIVVFCGSAAIAAKPGAVPTTQPDPQRVAIESELKSVEALLTAGKPDEALAQVVALRPKVVALDPRQHRDLFRATACAWRMAQLASISDHAGELVPQLAQLHPDAMRVFVFALSPADDNPGKALAVLEVLTREFPRDVDRYASLAAAIALVHDDSQPRAEGVEQRTPTPEDVFSFYVGNDRRLATSPRNLPPELLVYVVDAHAPIGELQWALDRYGRQQNIGARFFDVPYDYDSFRSGAEKQIVRRGYTLPNLVRFGGVCSDQAYFASSVGKALGVPSAVVTGQGADVGHAWIGYLESRGRETAWNLENGRYDAYKGVRGVTTDPQTQRIIFEGELRLLSELVYISDNDRLDAIAIADIAGFESFGDNDETYDMEPKPKSVFQSRKALPQAKVRYSKADEQLLRASVELNPGCMIAWRQVRRLSPNFDADQRKAWGDAIFRLCGRKYPDFAVTLVTPMIDALPDAQARDQAWQAAGRLYGSNVDVAADICLAQARNWQKAGDSEMALRRCEDVIRNCAAAGPRVVEATNLAESILLSQGRENAILQLYAAAFDSLIVPGDMGGQFMRQTPWYRVGTRYCHWLEEAGDQSLAAKIGRKLDNLAGTRNVPND